MTLTCTCGNPVERKIQLRNPLCLECKLKRRRIQQSLYYKKRERKPVAPMPSVSEWFKASQANLHERKNY